MIAGDIGKPIKRIELEPLPEQIPVPEPVAPLPEPKREEVPA